MKKLAIILCGVGLSAVALGQGSINTFNAFTPPGGSGLAYVLDVDGTQLAAGTGRVELFADAAGTTYLSSVSDGTGNALAAPGIFSLGVRVVPGSTVGQPATVYIRAWDNTTGATWDSALERSELVAVTFASIGGATAPSNFVTGSDFTGLQLEIVPEPTTVALAALGLGGLFFMARRKK